MLTRVGAALVLLFALLAGSVAPAVALAATAGVGGTAASVVIVGVPGLRWDDVSARGTPTLWRLAAQGSVGSLSVRTTHSRTCPIDGWLTVGAGNKARGPHTGRDCRPTEPWPGPRAVAGGGAIVPNWAQLERINADLNFDARPGELGQALARAGRCAAAVGPAAAYGAADAAGRVAAYRPSLAGVSAAFLTRCPLTLVALGALRGYDDAGEPSLPAEPAEPTDAPLGARPADRAAAVARIDAGLAAVDAARPAGGAMLVVGLSETGRSVPRLHLALALGPAPAGRGYGAGRLTSASTRRAPFVQLVGVAPTALDLLGIPLPERLVGQDWRPTGGRAATERATVNNLVDLDRAAQAQRRLTPPFFAIVVIAQAVLYLAAALALRGRQSARRRRRILTATRITALAFAAVPVCTYLANLVPWWRQDQLLLTLFGVVAAADVAVVGLALLGPWRRAFLGPFGVVAGVTFAVLAADVLTGARLQVSSLIGYSPIVAGRFAGFGNIAYAIFATSALLLAAALAHGRSRRTALAVTIGVGAVAVVLDGSPLWGSDFGGVLGLVPGVAVLAMLCARIRVSVLRFVAACAGGVALVTAFAVADYLRPAAEQTHLGRFVGEVLDGTAGTVVARKATANLHLLTHSPLTLLLPLAVAFLAFVLLRPARSRAAGLQLAFDRSRALRAGLLGVLVTSVVGFFVNDSGVAIPALAITVAVPLALAASARALELDEVADHDGAPRAAHPARAPATRSP